MNGRPPDDNFEERLRAAFARARPPALPPTIRATAQQLRTGEGPVVARPRQANRALGALVGIAATVAIIAFVGLVSSGRPSAGPAASISPTGRTTSSPPLASPGALSAVPWSGSFVPAALAAVDAGHLVLVGGTGDGTGSGVVATSSDGGRGWVVQRLPVSALDGVAAAGSTIWATTSCAPDAPAGCEGGLIVSTDSGKSWRLTALAGLWHPGLLDPAHGWALSPVEVRNPSTVSVTADGGATWSRTSAPCRQTAWGAWALQYVSAATGWAACIGDSGAGSETKELLGTTDGGATWSVLAAESATGAAPAVGSIPLEGQLGGISMRADGRGWLWTDRGLYASEDGGRTWRSAGWASSDGSTAVVSAVLTGDEAGYAIVRDSSAYLLRFVSTTDGGKSWTDLGGWPFIVYPTPSASPSPETVRFAGFASASVGWALTDRRLELTDDGGRTWRSAGPPIDYAGTAPKGASFFDAQRGWVVSQDTFTSSLTLWATADGGATWTRTTLPGVPIPAETMGDATIVWIDRSHAVIDIAGGMPNGYLDGLLFTADGGATWSEPAMRSVTPNAGGITGAPVFLDPQIGWLAGGAPGTRLWATRDGGQTWRLQQLAVPAGYADDRGTYPAGPRFFTRSDGVIVRVFFNDTSAVTVIYRTTDGGKTWQPTSAAVPPGSWPSFVSATDWIVWDGTHDRFWRSTDQGATWSAPIAMSGSPTGTPVFTDQSHGWAFTPGGSGELSVTSDGGVTWSRVGPGL